MKNRTRETKTSNFVSAHWELIMIVAAVCLMLLSLGYWLASSNSGHEIYDSDTFLWSSTDEYPQYRTRVYTSNKNYETVDSLEDSTTEGTGYTKVVIDLDQEDEDDEGITNISSEANSSSKTSLNISSGASGSATTKSTNQTSSSTIASSTTQPTSTQSASAPNTSPTNTNSSNSNLQQISTNSSSIKAIESYYQDEAGNKLNDADSASQMVYVIQYNADNPISDQDILDLIGIKDATHISISNSSNDDRTQIKVSPISLATTNAHDENGTEHQPGTNVFNDPITQDEPTETSENTNTNITIADEDIPDCSSGTLLIYGSIENGLASFKTLTVDVSKNYIADVKWYVTSFSGYAEMRSNNGGMSPVFVISDSTQLDIYAVATFMDGTQLTSNTMMIRMNEFGRQLCISEYSVYAQDFLG